MTGLMVMIPDEVKAYPDNAWIVGNVSDGANPVENAYVKVMLFMNNPAEINWTLTDVDGDYSMMVPGGLQYMVLVANGSFYMAMNQVLVAPGDTAVSNFTLVPITETADVTISGYVTDEFGTPRSDGHVLAMVNNPLGGDMPYYANVTTPDPSGYFEIKVIPGPRGGGAAGMDFPGYPMMENSTSDPFLPGSSHTFNIELKPQTYSDDSSVYGYVTEMGTGLPLESAVVSYESDDGMNRYSNWTLTNDTGYYEMGVQTGSYLRLTFQKIGYTVRFFEPDVLPGVPLQQDAMLRQTTAVIKGNITDAVTGNPLVFARVYLVDNTSMQENLSFSQTDAYGYYELGAFEGNDLYFGAEQDGYARNFSMINVTSGDVLWRDVTLWPYSAWLVGQVTDAMSGAPISGANVHISGPIEEGRNTDGMGMYNFSVVPGDYYVEVNYWMGGPGYKMYNDNITILDGMENVLDVALVPWQNALIRGFVYDNITGDPVSGANIGLNGWWGNSTNSDPTGYYEMYSADGSYTLNVDAMGYENYWEDIILAEMSVTDKDIYLMPRNPATTTLMHGYVTSSDDSSPVTGAEVRIRLDGGSFENSTMTNPSGYYEMYVPPWVLNVRCTASMHAPYFGQINLTGVTDYAFDISLDRDLFRPNMTHSQSPLENISTVNPSVIDVTIEEENLREMTLMFFMQWNSSGTDSNWTLIQYMRTSFDPWSLENNLGYTMVDGNYSVNYMWHAWGLGGMLGNGSGEVYLPGSVWPWYFEPLFSVSGMYTNESVSSIQGSAMFNTTTGDYVAFWPNGWMSPIMAPDPTGVFEPWAFVIEIDNGTFVNFNWRTLGSWDVDGLRFYSMTSFPSGNYITEFYTQDFGNQGDAFLNFVTVDNDGPIADAGTDQSVPANAIVTLDGTGSTDNVGIVSYTWEFYNATGVWTILSGDVVTCSFELPGTYDIDLTVWDAAGHMSMDSLVVDVFTDFLPIADAGPDQSVDEDVLVTFDGSGSTDDNGIVNYTWTISELSVVLYEVGPTYTFLDPGTYHVSLVVRDTVGQSSAPDEMIVTAADVTPPTADAGSDQLVLIGTLVTMNGSASTDNVGVVNYTWSFTDGTPVELYGMEVTYTFMTDGSYIVTLNATDAAGNWATDTLTVDVISDARPVADAGLDQTVDEDTVVTFDGSGSSDDHGVVNYTWTIVELSVTMYDVGPTYTFDTPGVYHVSLIVYDTVGQASDPDEMIVTVEDVTPPTPDPGSDQRVNDGVEVTLDGTASTDNVGIVNYTWSFTDGVYIELYDSIATYTFSGPGWYWVDLTVTDAAGNSATAGIWVVINGPPVAGTSGDQWITPGDWAYFGGWWCWDDLDGYYDLQYTWTFTYDGSEVQLIGNNPDVYFQFAIPGIYTVNLTVTDTGGFSDDASMRVLVFDYLSSWWVDPMTGDTIVDGDTISLDYVIMRGYVDSWEDVSIITTNGVYETTADGDGLFEVDPIALSEGLNIVSVSTYSDWMGYTVSWLKMIQSDTYCVLYWNEVPDSPTSDIVVNFEGRTDPGAGVTVNGFPLSPGPDGTFSVAIGLAEGPNMFHFEATDAVGNMVWSDFTIELDTTPPALLVSGPGDGANVSEPNVVVFGTVDSGASVSVNGVMAAAGTDWSVTVSLVEGANTIVVTATDSLGNTATETLVVNYVPPVYVTPEELAAVRAELQGEIDNLTAALTENVTALQDQIDTAMGEISALQTSLAENITALQVQIDTAMDEILALQTSLAENITLLQTQIDAAMDDIAALQASVAENVTDLQGQIDIAMADIAGLQASLLENVTGLQTQITAAMADIVTLETALTENVTALQGQIADAVLDITELQSALSENVTALQNDIAVLEADLQANITALQQAIAQNATALQQALAQNVTALQSQIAALRSDLQANVTSLTAALAANVTALEGLVDTLDQDVADVQAQLAAVNSTLMAAQNQTTQAIDSMQADLVDLQQQIDELNQTAQDAEDKAKDTDSFASMLMYLTLILFAIAAIMVGLVWYLTSKKLGRGGAGPPANALEEVEGPTEVEREFESLEKEIKDEEL